MMQLNPDVKSVWVIYYIRRTLFLIIISFVFDYFVLSEMDNWPLFFGFLPLIIFVLGAIFTIVFPKLKYNNWFFELKDDELFLKRG